MLSIVGNIIGNVMLYSPYYHAFNYMYDIYDIIFSEKQLGIYP